MATTSQRTIERGDGTKRKPGDRAQSRRVNRRSVEFLKCAADAAYFSNEYLVIDDAQNIGEGTGTIPFKLWRSQVKLLWTLMNERLTVILKARQLGISWAVCGYVLWRCLFQPGQVILLFSQGQDEANELLRRVRVLYERLPEWLRIACPLSKPPNTEAIHWANESRVLSLPATQKAGRSFTASVVVMDEAAHMTWAGALYTAAKPTIDGGGQMIILSTANGIGNLFHSLWTRASAGLNQFKTIFLPWWERPGRDAVWYEAKVSEESDPGLVKQEYPSSATEAFRVSGRTRFAIEWIEAQVGNIRSSLPKASWPDSLKRLPANLNVYALPIPSHRYIVGADVAEGLEHGDKCDAVVIDAITFEEMASLNGTWEPSEFAMMLEILAFAYNAMLAVERNNHGHAVLAILSERGCPFVGLGLDGRPGWLTNLQTKPYSIDILAMALRDNLIKIRCQAALDELAIYRVLPNGSTGAPQSYHDDRVMSRAIALAYARIPPDQPAEIHETSNPLAYRQWGVG